MALDNTDTPETCEGDTCAAAEADAGSNVQKIEAFERWIEKQGLSVNKLKVWMCETFLSSELCAVSS